MTSSTFFVRPCPSCGRSAQIRIDFLGQDVCCQHCLRRFTANDPESESAALDDPVNYWVNYTEHEGGQTAITERHHLGRHQVRNPR